MPIYPLLKTPRWLVDLYSIASVLYSILGVGFSVFGVYVQRWKGVHVAKIQVVGVDWEGKMDIESIKSEVLNQDYLANLLVTKYLHYTFVFFKMQVSSGVVARCTVDVLSAHSQ